MAYTNGISFVTVEVNICDIPRKSGKFEITATGKGSRADEAEMDSIAVSGKVINNTTIRCYWGSSTFVKGNFKFDYFISV